MIERRSVPRARVAFLMLDLDTWLDRVERLCWEHQAMIVRLLVRAFREDPERPSLPLANLGRRAGSNERGIRRFLAELEAHPGIAIVHLDRIEFSPMLRQSVPKVSANFGETFGELDAKRGRLSGEIAGDGSLRERLRSRSIEDPYPAPGGAARTLDLTTRRVRAVIHHAFETHPECEAAFRQNEQDAWADATALVKNDLAGAGVRLDDRPPTWLTSQIEAVFQTRERRRARGSAR